MRGSLVRILLALLEVVHRRAELVDECLHRRYLLLLSRHILLERGTPRRLAFKFLRLALTLFRHVCEPGVQVCVRLLEFVGTL